MLNVDRPQNPFTPTDELDWKPSETASGGSHTLEQDKSKDRNSHRLPPTSDGSQPLLLDTNWHSLRKEVALRGPDSRSSSRSSVVSTSSNRARKAAPPIPKKPALLSNRRHNQESRDNAQGDSTSSRPPLGGNTTYRDIAETKFPPPQQSTKQQDVYAQRPTESDGPPLPPRNTGASISISNGLMDDDDEGASAIPSLQPMRRQQH